MNVRGLVEEIYRRDRVLAITGWLHVGLLVAMLAVAPFDHRLVMGLNLWVKPMKFAISIAIYLWTLAWFLKYLPGPRWARQAIRWGASIAMTAEILCIGLQAARGTTSHYNNSTPFNTAVFATMAFMILVNTLVAAFVLLLFLLRRVELAPAYRWGIRLGLLVFVVGSLEGMVMIFHNAHTVGLLDGGPGLPLVNWSTRAGDLRIAHLLGLHALQILPLAGYWVSGWKTALPAGRQVACVFVFFLAYAGITIFLFWQALHGRPLISL